MPVHGSRQPAPAPTTTRSRSAPIDGFVEAKAVREFLVTRIPQDLLTVVDYDRHVFGIDLKPIE